MIIGKVIGNVVSTIKIGPYKGHKILIVVPIDPKGNSQGKSFLALDNVHVQAGPGDRVIVIDEGGSAALMLKDTKGTIRTVIAGIVDEVNLYA